MLTAGNVSPTGSKEPHGRPNWFGLLMKKLHQQLEEWEGIRASSHIDSPRRKEQRHFSSSSPLQQDWHKWCGLSEVPRGSSLHGTAAASTSSTEGTGFFYSSHQPEHAEVLA